MPGAGPGPGPEDGGSDESGQFVKCLERHGRVVVKPGEKIPADGEVIEVRCTYDPDTRGGNAPDGRKVKATLHWVSAGHAVPAEVRLYSHLFTTENPADAEEGEDFTSYINPASLEILSGCQVEPGLAEEKQVEPEGLHSSPEALS